MAPFIKDVIFTIINVDGYGVVFEENHHPINVSSSSCQKRNDNLETWTKNNFQWCDNMDKDGNLQRDSNVKPVQNKDDIISLERKMQNYDHKIIFEHVPGHSGNKLNNLADRLAKEGAEKFARSSNQ